MADRQLSALEAEILAFTKQTQYRYMQFALPALGVYITLSKDPVEIQDVFEIETGAGHTFIAKKYET